ncbi:hypothetical protein BGZ46_002222 [Entomortierella lignicola]|nr:hypothetical protein BGZ46_002222 [Entomortierella lignicola]
MRLSTTSLVALSSLTLLATSSFNHGNTLVSAKLTPEERVQVEAKDPSNPNYCPACLVKALSNHFPHACPKGIDPIAATTRPEGPEPFEQRCICVAFTDLGWMKQDCSLECPFVHNPQAMNYFLSTQKIKGCEKWIDMDTNEEIEVEGFEMKDPNHKPVVYDDTEELYNDIEEKDTDVVPEEEILENAEQEQEQKEVPKEDEPKQEEEQQTQKQEQEQEYRQEEVVESKKEDTQATQENKKDEDEETKVQHKVQKVAEVVGGFAAEVIEGTIEEATLNTVVETVAESISEAVKEKKKSKAPQPKDEL